MSPAQVEEVEEHKQDAAAQIAQAQAAKASLKEKEQKTTAKLAVAEKAGGCAAGPTGIPLSLQEREVCNKNKAAELLSTEKSTKINAKNDAIEVETEEKKNKQKEKNGKESGEKKTATKERDTKETQTRERTKDCA